MVSCAPRPMISSRQGSPLLPAVSYSMSIPLALMRATLPRPLRCVQRRRQPGDGLGCGTQGRFLRAIGGGGIVCNRRPGAGILDVAAEFLEAAAAVRPAEQVDATVVMVVLDAVEDRPALVDSPRHGFSIGRAWPPTNRRAACATERYRRARE